LEEYPNKNIQIEGELTGFAPEEVFGEGDSLHNLARLGKIIRTLDARSSLTADGWAALFKEAFTTTVLQEHHHLARLKTFAIRLALSNPKITFDSMA
jgi:hypothetical protein